MPALNDDEFCFTHSPQRAAERAARNRRGGARRSNLARAQRLVASSELSPVFAQLSQALDAVVAGRIEPAQATAAATLARAMCGLVETVELGARLAALEAAMNERSGL